jgi:hypothetical protein
LPLRHHPTLRIAHFSCKYRQRENFQVCTGHTCLSVYDVACCFVSEAQSLVACSWVDVPDVSLTNPPSLSIHVSSLRLHLIPHYHQLRVRSLLLLRGLLSLCVVSADAIGTLGDTLTFRATVARKTNSRAFHQLCWRGYLIEELHQPAHHRV